VRVELDPLSKDDLFQILTVPSDSVVREYQALLKMDGVDLRFEDEALREVVQFSLRRKTGRAHPAGPGRQKSATR